MLGYTFFFGWSTLDILLTTSSIASTCQLTLFRVLVYCKLGLDVRVHSQKKRYKSCHWDSTLQKGTNMYHLGTNMYTFGTNMYL